MSLSAFTNAPGNHVKTDIITGFESGKYYGWEGIQPIYSAYVHTDQVIKWNPTPGYSGCTDWSRSVRKLFSNRPSIRQRRVHVGGELVVNLRDDYHISLDHDLGSYIVPDSGYDNGKDASVTKALNSLQSHYAGLGNDLGEARKTCDGFSKMALRAGTLLKAFRERDFSTLLRGSKSASRTLADLWLEYSYGWKPLAQDLYEEQQIVHKVLQKPIPIQSIGHGSSEHAVDFNWENRYQHTGATKSTHRTVLNAHVTNPYLAGLAEAGLINPASIAWELVPWSFVIDWFVPIGATLQAITATVGLESDGGFTSSQTKDILQMTAILSPDDGSDGYRTVDGGFYEERGFSFHRQCYAGFPFPRLFADQTPYSTPRAINALALIRQLT